MKVGGARFFAGWDVRILLLEFGVYEIEGGMAVLLVFSVLTTMDCCVPRFSGCIAFSVEHGGRTWERKPGPGRTSRATRELVFISCMDGRGVWVRQPVWERETPHVISFSFSPT